MKLKLPLSLLSIILVGMTLQDSLAIDLPLIQETLEWDVDGSYNQCNTLKDKTSYEYTFQGSSGDTFSFTELDEGIFYWKPNQGGNLSFIGADKTLNLTFNRNVLSSPSNNAASGPIIHIYTGEASFSNFNKLIVANNTSAYDGGAFYVYKGLLAFDNINSIEFNNNTIQRRRQVVLLRDTI